MGASSTTCPPIANAHQRTHGGLAHVLGEWSIAEAIGCTLTFGQTPVDEVCESLCFVEIGVGVFANQDVGESTNREGLCITTVGD